MLKRYQHNPAHLLVNNTPYFITAAIYQKRRLLKTHNLKIMLQHTLHRVFVRYDWQLHHWVILDNHYHLLGQSLRGADLPHLMKDIHLESAVEIQNATGCDMPVWWNYWDYCPRNERDLMVRQNYLFYNPVKHGYVTNLRDYPYSSFHQTFEQLGREALVQQFTNYAEYKTLRIHDGMQDDF